MAWVVYERPKQPRKPTERPASVAFRANLDDPRHGTKNGYDNLGCRCDRCKAAHLGVWRARKGARNL